MKYNVVTIYFASDERNFINIFLQRAREGYGNNNNNRSGAKPYATIMEPKTDYG